MQNTAKRNLFIWLLVGLAGFFVFLAPIIFPIDMMNGGGAMIMIGILFAITGPIVALLFWHRARLFDQLMDENALLIHWRYNPVEWKRFAEDERVFRGGEQRWLQLVVLFFSLLFGGIFWWADPEVGWIVALVLLGVNLLIVGVVWLNSRSYAKWELDQNVECRIGPKGLIINRMLHSWSGWGARLEGARVNTGKINIIEIVYSTPNRYSRQFFTIRVPIPSGEENKAQETVNKLSS